MASISASNASSVARRSKTACGANRLHPRLEFRQHRTQGVRVGLEVGKRRLGERLGDVSTPQGVVVELFGLESLV